MEATEQNGLDETASARCEETRAISARRLLRPPGRVDPPVMLSVSRTLQLLPDV